MKEHKIIKKIKQVTGTAKGVTFTKEDLSILDADKDDVVEVKKVEWHQLKDNC